MYIHIYIERETCVYIYMYLYIYIYIYTYTYTYIYMYTYIHTCIHTYVHTYIHTHIYIYIHIHIDVEDLPPASGQRASLSVTCDAAGTADAVVFWWRCSGGPTCLTPLV